MRGCVIKNSRKSFCLLFLVVLALFPFLTLLVHSTTTVSPSSSLNLEPISAFYPDMNGAAASYASLDYGTLHNGDVSIRTGPDYVRGTREVDGAWLNVKPGDHIVFSAWIKTATYTSNSQYSGAEIGLDFYIHSNLGYGIATVDTAGHQAGHPQNAEIEQDYSSFTGGITYVHWGQDWTQITWDLTVPTTYYNYVTISSNSLPFAPYSCSSVQIDSVVPWFEGRDVSANANCWFADPVFLINPVDSATTASSPSNITVTNIMLQQSLVESGFTFPVGISLQNKGSSSETAQFHLIATSKNFSTLIYNGTETLGSGNSIIINSSLGSENLPIGNYTITAYVESSSGQANTFSPITLGVTPKGDLNGDFRVDGNDFIAFSRAYNSYWNNGYVNPAADFNHDGKIDSKDFTAFVSAYNIYWNQK